MTTPYGPSGGIGHGRSPGESPDPEWPTRSLPPEQGFFAPESDEPPPKRRRERKPPAERGEQKSRLPLVIALGIAVVLLGFATLAFVWPAFLVKRVLDSGAVEEGVQRVLTEGYKIEKVKDVSCPASRELRLGNTFECTVKVDTREQTVPITVKTEDGQYEVARPK